MGIWLVGCIRLVHYRLLSPSKVKCKRILQHVKLAYANEIVYHFPGVCDFWHIADSLLSKGKPTISVLFSGTEVLSSASNKAKLSSKDFSRNSHLNDSHIFLSAFPSRTNLKLHNIPVTPKLVQKVITYLDLLKVSGPDCIIRVVLKNCESNFQMCNMCLKKFCLLDFGKDWLWSLHLRLLGERTTTEN